LKFVYIGIGGAIGSILRYAVAGVAQKLVNPIFPLGTLVVNMLGSLAIGFLWDAFERTLIPPGLRTFTLIGLLGAFTTFSTYSLESFSLMRDGEYRLAIINILASNILCLAMVFAGFFLSRFIYGFGR